MSDKAHLPIFLLLVSILAVAIIWELWELWHLGKEDKALRTQNAALAATKEES